MVNIFFYICIILKKINCLSNYFICFFNEIYFLLKNMLLYIYSSVNENIQKIEISDIVLIIVNLIFFIFIQMIFFVYVVSNLYETLLTNKINFVKTLEDNNSNIKSLIQNIKHDFIENYKNNTFDTIEYFNQLKSQRLSINNNLTLLYGGVPIVVLCFILLCIFIKKNVKNNWNSSHTFGFILIILSYIVEVILFFCVISQYEFIGDNYLIYNFLKNVLY